jgi:putative transcriptional regulator
MVRGWSGTLAMVVAVLCSAPILPAQSTHDLGIGRVLVAKRDAPDSTFAETVILVVRYTQSGTVGLMLNRRTEVPVSRVLDPLKGASGRSDPVYAGGPVELANVLALLRTNAMPEGPEHVTGKVYLVSTGALLEKTLAKRPDPADFKVYLGYCGWSPGQLENEISRGFWRVLSGSADIVFDSEPETLWSRLIERAEERIARAQSPVVRMPVATKHALNQAPACAPKPTITAMLEIGSGGSPCRFAR